MPKPKPVVPLQRVEFRLPGKLHAAMLIHLYSPLEEKVPYGAVGDYITRLIREDLEKKNADKDQELV